MAARVRVSVMLDREEVKCVIDEWTKERERVKVRAKLKMTIIVGVCQMKERRKLALADFK